MIQRKRKICSQCGKPEFLFSGGFCRTCWGINKAKLATLRPKWTPSTSGQRKSVIQAPTPIKKRSTKEDERLREYNKRMKEIEDSTPNKVCHFCSKAIEGEWDRHHLFGRTGESVYNTDDIVFVHRKCHTEYHSFSVEKLSWHRAWMGKLLWEDRAQLYNKERGKYEK